jgi:hypothetical protein
MANQQTKSYRKLGISTSNGGASIGTVKSFDKFEGRFCYTDFKDKDKNPQNKRKSPWRGASRTTAKNNQSE